MYLLQVNVPAKYMQKTNAFAAARGDKSAIQIVTNYFEHSTLAMVFDLSLYLQFLYFQFYCQI